MNEQHVTLVRRLLSFAAIGGLAMACMRGDARRPGVPDPSVADVLWLPSGARLEHDLAYALMIRNGRSIYVDGSASVVFTINMDGDELTRKLVENFAAAGWRQRSTQYSNPGLPTSFEKGWYRHGGGLIVETPDPTIPREPYRRWDGEWQDQRGNVVAYHLGGQGRELRGTASYIPRPLVEQASKKRP